MSVDNLMPKAKSAKEEIYIFKRRIIAFLNSLIFMICRIFPIDNKLVSVCTFEGKGGFGCNPKYVVQELHRQDETVKFVWFVNPDIIDKKQFPDYIRKVPNTLWSRAYWLTRSRVWIDNYRKPYGTVKRKGQYYLNVNHYTIGIKCTGLWRGEGFSKMAYLVSKNDSDMIDDLVIDSEWCEKAFPKGLIYSGNYLKTGAPRCDVLYGNRQSIKESYRKKINLPENSKIVMFAPTFREGAKNGVRSVYSEIWTIDFKRLLNNLEKKFGGEWYLCVRVHPQLSGTFDDYNDPELKGRIINESKADDMYEILAAMDAYITDYSSACFEAGFAHIPTFIYADDIEKFSNDRGALYWNIEAKSHEHIGLNKSIFSDLDAELPFSISENNDELEKAISEFDFEIYNRTLDIFHDSVKLVFNGNASYAVSKKIIEFMGK